MNSQAETYQVRLTAAQRKVIAELFPDLVDRLKLEEKHLRTIAFTSLEAAAIRNHAEGVRLQTKNGRTYNSLLKIHQAITEALEKSAGTNTSTKSAGIKTRAKPTTSKVLRNLNDLKAVRIADRVFQFRIALLKAPAPIWRRIQVKNCTLHRLHEHIQAAMGWFNSHLYEFEIHGNCFSDPESLDDGFGGFDGVDSNALNLSQIMPYDGQKLRFLYVYDFGDDWQHEVIFEGILRADKTQKYPLCIAGKRRCPPENVGGVWGYAEFLQALADPEREGALELEEWAADFDPEQFDAAEATESMQMEVVRWTD